MSYNYAAHSDRLAQLCTRRATIKALMVSLKNETQQISYEITQLKECMRDHKAAEEQDKFDAEIKRNNELKIAKQKYASEQKHERSRTAYQARLANAQLANAQPTKSYDKPQNYWQLIKRLDEAFLKGWSLNVTKCRPDGSGITTVKRNINLPKDLIRVSNHIESLFYNAYYVPRGSGEAGYLAFKNIVI